MSPVDSTSPAELSQHIEHLQTFRDRAFQVADPFGTPPETVTPNEALRTVNPPDPSDREALDSARHQARELLDAGGADLKAYVENPKNSTGPIIEGSGQIESVADHPDKISEQVATNSQSWDRLIDYCEKIGLPKDEVGITSDSYTKAVSHDLVDKYNTQIAETQHTLQTAVNTPSTGSAHLFAGADHEHTEGETQHVSH